MAPSQSSLDKIGLCGKAFVKALIANPTALSAVKSLLVYELAAIQQAILLEGEKLEKFDIFSKTSNLLTQALNRQLSQISRVTNVAKASLDAFSGCVGVDSIANSIDMVERNVEQKVAETLATITGRDEKIGDLKNQQYEAQKLLTGRRITEAGITKLEEKRETVLAFLDAIENWE